MATQTIAKGYGGKAQFVALPSVARALAQEYTSDDFVVPYGKTLTVVINITAGAGTPAVTPRIKGRTAAGILYTALLGAQVTSTSAAVVTMRIGSGVAEVTNLGSGVPVPATFFLSMTHADTDSLTYSIDCEVS